MSFFADMIAGGLAGAGKGMSDYAVMQEREDDKRAQLEAQMQLKREMLADQLANKRDIAEMRWGDGSGSGRGSGGRAGSGLNLFQMMMEASTPAEQDKVVKLASMLDKNAGAAMADQFYGRPVQEQVATQAPTTGDLARFDRGEQDSIPELTTTSRAVSYDKQKGAVALQRMYTLIMDPSKLENYADGERKTTMNDFGAAAARQVGAETGGDMEEAGKTFGTISNPNLNTSKDDLRAQQLEQTARRTDAMIDNGSKNRSSAEARARTAAALKELQLAQAAEKDATGKNRVERAANTKAALDRLAKLSEQEAAVPDVQPATPLAFPYTPRKPSAAAAAYRNGK